MQSLVPPPLLMKHLCISGVGERMLLEPRNKSQSQKLKMRINVAELLLAYLSEVHQQQR